jgi:hypothetical protein
MYLTQRSGVFSILVGSLINILHSRVIAGHDTFPDDLVAIITGHALGYAQNVEVATTRVPDFSNGMQDPLHGYRSLGKLSDIQNLLVPPPVHIDRQRELLALQSNHPQTTSYAEIWNPFGLNTATHFILIFHLPRAQSSSLSSSRYGSPSPFLQSARGSWSSSSTDTSSSASPAGFHALSPATSTTVLSSAANRMPSPLRSCDAFTNVDLPPTEPGVINALPDSDLGEKESAADVLTPEAAVDNVCRQFNITSDTIAAAKYDQERAKTLLAMIVNHRAMASILVTLQFHDPESRTPYAKGKTVTFNDGLQLSTEDVLWAFGWSWESYNHKTKWYSWAEDAAQSSEWDPTRLGM